VHLLDADSGRGLGLGQVLDPRNIADAQRENDSDLADFFKRAQDASRRGAEQGKELLAKRL
jgi:hypothetical protein